MEKRSDACRQLLELYKSDPTLIYHTIACDETTAALSKPHPDHAWIYPNDPGPPAVRQQFPNTRHVSIFFDSRGFIHIEILAKKGATVDSELYCKQLERVKDKLLRRRPTWPVTYLLQDNASPHRSHLTTEKIQQLEWIRLPHPPYSPDLNPTDYGANRSLAHALEGKEFRDEIDLAKFIEEWADAKSQSFFLDQFEQLPKRWEAVIKCDGGYFEEKEVKKSVRL